MYDFLKIGVETQDNYLDVGVSKDNSGSLAPGDV